MKTLKDKRRTTGFSIESDIIVYPEEDVKEFLEELNQLLIDSNKVCGQALLNRKDEGYSVEHIFDNFFKRMQEGIDKLSGFNYSPLSRGSHDISGDKEPEDNSIPAKGRTSGSDNSKLKGCGVNIDNDEKVIICGENGLCPKCQSSNNPKLKSYVLSDEQFKKEIEFAKKESSDVCTNCGKPENEHFIGLGKGSTDKREYCNQDAMVPGKFKKKEDVCDDCGHEKEIKRYFKLIDMMREEEKSFGLTKEDTNKINEWIEEINILKIEHINCKKFKPKSK